MAVKKTTKKKDESAAPTKAEAKETAPKKAPKKKATAAPEAATTPAPAEAAATPAPAKKAAPKKAAAPIKLSASQGDLLKKISEAAETGYTVAKKVEERSIESLLSKKLIKKGAKDKASGLLRYHISSSGKKHLTTP
jgi:hypothetical protein